MKISKVLIAFIKILLVFKSMGNGEHKKMHIFVITKNYAFITIFMHL